MKWTGRWGVNEGERQSLLFELGGGVANLIVVESSEDGLSFGVGELLQHEDGVTADESGVDDAVCVEGSDFLPVFVS